MSGRGAMSHAYIFFLYTMRVIQYYERSMYDTGSIMTTTQEITADTVALLEDRLRLLTYILHGSTSNTAPTSNESTIASAPVRLRGFHQALQTLAARLPAAADILSLQTQHPYLLIPTEATPSPQNLPTLVLAHQTLYSTLSTQLSQLQTTALVDSAPFTKLLELNPRIAKVLAKQDEQAQAVAELRARSAKVVEKWYVSEVQGMGEAWAGWEERVREGEILVRRKEAVKRREEGVV
ncbi:hypothetical protein B0A50_06223 [Salinomyces thailandicus]|uniref:Nuclear distribution protein RO10 n=1 Tax=Salinomyces thailandicus TaxID=706561 RepID=A0A4V5N4B4_9PEZI|nr:hypothetical protein B0A50_06223 [Salinomyces thailandica]